MSQHHTPFQRYFFLLFGQACVNFCPKSLTIPILPHQAFTDKPKAKLNVTSRPKCWPIHHEKCITFQELGHVNSSKSYVLRAVKNVYPAMLYPPSVSLLWHLSGKEGSWERRKNTWAFENIRVHNHVLKGWQMKSLCPWIHAEISFIYASSVGHTKMYFRATRLSIFVATRPQCGHISAPSNLQHITTCVGNPWWRFFLARVMWNQF